MKQNWLFVLRYFVAVLALLFTPVALTQHVLNIPPVMQQTGSWCWLATGQMIFQYYGLPANGTADYQCGEARGQGALLVPGGVGQGAFAGPCWPDCRPCAPLGAGTMKGMYNLVTQYPGIVALTAGNTTLLQATLVAAPLTFAELQAEIDAGRPVAAGISPGMVFLPPLVSEHAVLIVGYDATTKSVIVNDPFPYQAQHILPSYLQVGVGGSSIKPRGRFSVPYDALVGPIQWKNTVYGISVLPPPQ